MRGGSLTIGLGPVPDVRVVPDDASSCVVISSTEEDDNLMAGLGPSSPQEINPPSLLIKS